MERLLIKMNFLICMILICFFSANKIYAAGRNNADTLPIQNETSGSNYDVSDMLPDIQQPARQTNEWPEQVMKALSLAYPERIERVEFRNNDWAVLLRDKWYFYAEGRILPEDQIKNTANFSRLPFYSYPKELPEWSPPSDEIVERYKNMMQSRSTNTLRRSTHFFDDLWSSHTREESYQRIKTIRFLGMQVNVHYLIMEELVLVEETILTQAKTDPSLQAWIDSLDRLEGWIWRTIADNGNRSYHSYGIAIDIIPKTWGGKETYWLWAARSRPDWWNISYNERYHPPQAVIKAFEKYGFIWGGKWAIFDTMHFEYRPDILILSGMPPEMRR